MRSPESVHPELIDSTHPYPTTKIFVFGENHDFLTPQQKTLIYQLTHDQAYPKIAENRGIAYQTLKNNMRSLIRTLHQHFPDNPKPQSNLEVILLLHQHGILRLVTPKPRNTR